MASDQMFHIFQKEIRNFTKLGPEDLIRELNKKEILTRLKAKKVPEALRMRVINFVEMHRPNATELEAYLRQLSA